MPKLEMRIAFAITVACMLCACAGPSDGEADRPEERSLVVGMDEDIRGSDPRRQRDGLSDAVHIHVAEGLVGLRNDLETAPQLAEKIDVRDGGRTYAFTLRRDVKFHNGAMLTSHEVLWSWNYLMAPDSLWRCRPVFSGQSSELRVISVEAPDDHVVIFRLADPSGIFLQSLARLDCAQTPILHPQSVHADGSWDRPVGTGPFMFARRSVGEYVELRRFADYSSAAEPPDGFVGRKQADVDVLKFLIIGDHATRMLGMQARDIDLTVIPSQLAAAAERNPRLRLMTAQSTVWQVLLLNNNDPLLKDRRIRQAIAAAIDRDAIARSVSYGQAYGSAGVLPSASRYYSPTSIKADPVRARLLLAEAGYSGEPITIVANKRFPAMFDCAVMIQDMLRAVGMNAHIEVVEWTLQLDRYVRGDYQAQSFAYSGRFSAVGAWERIIGTGSPKVWQDPEALALLRDAERTQDPLVLQRLLDRLQEKFIDDAPAVGLFLPYVNVAMQSSVSGLDNSPFESPRLWNVSIQPTTEHAN